MRSDRDRCAADRNPRRARAEVADELERSAHHPQPLPGFVELDRIRTAGRKLTADAHELCVERRERRVGIPRQLGPLERLHGLRIWDLLAELREGGEFAPP